jgi:putative membrane protein
MPYTNIDSKQMILRDHLAYDRTVLAIERTLLSYLRTAIAFLAGGITLIALFPGDMLATVGGVLSCAIGVCVLLLGTKRFFEIKQRLEAVYQSEAMNEQDSES